MTKEFSRDQFVKWGRKGGKSRINPRFCTKAQAREMGIKSAAKRKKDLAEKLRKRSAK